MGMSMTLRNLHCVPEFTNGRKEKKQKESKNILCSRVSFKEGKESKIKNAVFPSFI
ncbi:hypothetical protein HanRHA438_Chr13g0578791 [Helianthus annuus]|uniref:Uncharacterized protein n=1 Tax=Helianthus annuus TaxID=4232 RepID=A0A9K3EEI2_HELAN|nr:hypothetical protein HanXRQr2_Chr13g0567051 [Helianthus annuus]KAJ0475383.1 hypothetical protein HanHA300_Chr13g0464821 [Helianthus annuus]KAJ0479246.1 hypothetical protein HanIR_Chr13g0617871 [Helianthus annuus]KAJ0496186.1 hypothetical protein HanHA89_Chr13g0496841 [Helianthus annuus]KAJ0662260.1 hypothetical protein HanLR1_Chr13g0467421 [Helianthus annuus]